MTRQRSREGRVEIRWSSDLVVVVVVVVVGSLVVIA